jgi:hypothetical protein
MATITMSDGDVTITTSDDLRYLNPAGANWDVRIKRAALTDRSLDQLETLSAQLVGLVAQIRP